MENRGSKFYQRIMNQEAEKREKGIEDFGIFDLILSFMLVFVIVLLFFMLLFPDLVADFIESIFIEPIEKIFNAG